MKRCVVPRDRAAVFQAVDAVGGPVGILTQSVGDRTQDRRRVVEYVDAHREPPVGDAACGAELQVGELVAVEALGPPAGQLVAMGRLGGRPGARWP